MTNTEMPQNKYFYYRKINYLELQTDMDEFGRKWTQKKPPLGS